MLYTKKNGFSFGAALISIFVILILSTASLIGYISFRNGHQAVKNLANQMQDSIQARVEHDLNDFLTKPHALNQINAAAIQSGMINSRDLASLRRQFFHQILSFDSVMTCAFGSETGDFTSAGRRSEGVFDTALADKNLDNDYRVYLLDEQGEPAEIDKVVHNYQPQGRSWYRAAVEANGPTWSPIYIWASQNNIGISAVLPVYDKTGMLLGVQQSALALGYIGQFLQNIRVTHTEQIFIIERTGLLVASSISEPLLQEKTKGPEVKLERVSAFDSTNPLIGQTMSYLNRHYTSIDRISGKQQTEFEVKKQNYYLSVTPYADTYGLDWLVVIIIPQSDLMGAVEANARATILASMIILAVTLIVGIMITRKITYPILQLNQATQEMRRGQWKKIENTTPFKEVNQLTNSFNQMARQLSEILETLEQRVEERTSELTSVNKQMQIEIAERMKTETERERLITELQEALEHVKMLRGLLPICAHCKKIRDDDNKWHDVATYVRDHSEAEFTHGICPECMAKYYKDFSDNKKL